MSESKQSGSGRMVYVIAGVAAMDGLLFGFDTSASWRRSVLAGVIDAPRAAP